MESVFEQVAAVLAVCVVAGVLATLLRQPLIVGLIAAGIAVGPQALGLVEGSTEIELLADIGISLLLFVVGLKLDVRLVRKLGPVALLTGVGQIVFTSAFGFLIALWLGFSTVPAVYIAVALTFSSTIIIVKLLTDKRELDDLHGRIALGFLIVQDIGVVLAMIAITAVGDGNGDLTGEFVGVVLRGAVLVIAVVVLARYVLPRTVHLLARQSELLILFAVSYAVAIAAGAVLLGFSEEVGAFLAGMSLASSHYREAISGRLTTLRDFLLVFFFIDLGTRFELSAALDQLGPAVLFSLFVLIGNPIIVMVIMGALGYRKQVSFKAGLTVAQISEFSLILIALGAGLGHVGDDVVGLVTAVGLITISGSTYLIYGSDAIYRRIEPALRIFERAQPTANIDVAEDRPEPEFVVIGLGRFGRTVLEELRDGGDAVLGVDFDPRSVQSAGWDVPVVYGDAEDPGLPERLPLEHTRWVISTLRSVDANLQVLHAFQHHGYEGRIAVSADNPDDEALLRAAGAELTIRPLHVAAGPLLDRIHERYR
ncbi:cation:proton antiporter [Nitriliruptor alkaliphilus]|uniref:cation:proton antiporter n=1 Tax=Nitriliruptor alkaliphilus TaxID=427918 RepID=UPI000696532C|nr:cation:proton antiporter family protein [Nitriliruptor alkaliphilus]